MKYQVLLLALFHSGPTIGLPIMSTVLVSTSSSCSDNYLVADQDYTLVSYAINRNGEAHFGFDHSNSLPKLYFMESEKPMCSLFDKSRRCLNQVFADHVCSCEALIRDQFYRLTVNITAKLKYSWKSLALKWMAAGTSEIAESVPLTLKEVREGCPQMELVSIHMSFNVKHNFLVPGEDTITVAFQVSGNNSVHSFRGELGPQFVYTTTDGKKQIGCTGFDPPNGSCTDRAGIRDACSCVPVSPPGTYLLTFTKTAQKNMSGQSVRLVWPGLPELRSVECHLPPIRPLASDSLKAGANLHSVIGVGVFAVLSTLVGAAILSWENAAVKEKDQSNKEAERPEEIPQTKGHGPHLGSVAEHLEEFPQIKTHGPHQMSVADRDNAHMEYNMELASFRSSSAKPSSPFSFRYSI